MSEIYEAFYDTEFGLPPLSCSLDSGCVCFSEVDSEVIAFGMVHLMPEAIILIDQNYSLRNKVQALSLLHEQAIRVCRENNFPQLYAKVIDGNYRNLLIKHFSFNELEGKLIVKTVG